MQEKFNKLSSGKKILILYYQTIMMNMKSLKKMLSVKNLKKNHENILVGVLLLVLLVLVVVYVRKNRENFDDKEGGLVINFFHVEWCGYCKKAKPEVAKLEEEIAANGGQLHGVNVVVNSVDAEENKELAAAHNVQAYPTIVLVKKDGSPVELEKSCTYDNLSELIAQNAN